MAAGTSTLPRSAAAVLFPTLILLASLELDATATATTAAATTGQVRGEEGTVTTFRSRKLPRMLQESPPSPVRSPESAPLPSSRFQLPPLQSFGLPDLGSLSRQRFVHFSPPAPLHADMRLESAPLPGFRRADSPPLPICLRKDGCN